jgi:hypothetical protein
MRAMMHANVSPKPTITFDHTHTHHPDGTLHDEESILS